MLESNQRPRMFEWASSHITIRQHDDSGRCKLTNSSWLGGGSEVLISSVFDVPPPLGSLHLDTDLSPSTSPTARPSDSSDSDSETTEGDANGSRRDGGQAQKKKKKGRPAVRSRSSGFDSPLARLFGPVGAFGSGKGKAKKGDNPREKAKATGSSGTKPAAGSGVYDTPEEAKRRSSLEVNGAQDDSAQVRQLQKELAEVRESQLRMEEMLNKMLNPASDK